MQDWKIRYVEKDESGDHRSLHLSAGAPFCGYLFLTKDEDKNGCGMLLESSTACYALRENNMLGADKGQRNKAIRRQCNMCNNGHLNIQSYIHAVVTAVGEEETNEIVKNESCETVRRCSHP